MKFSRDLAREKSEDFGYEDTIALQVRKIADTGATHVAIGTPYDDEFVPFLTKWVETARVNNLKVWYRGNFSGWEGWFDYEKIDREEHKRKTQRFILGNPDLFQDGDIFTSCTECENGGPGDPRENGDVDGYRTFLLTEQRIAEIAFKDIGKDVATNYYPMNGDVAYLVMDKKMTENLGGVVVIDHYVKDALQLSNDVKKIVEKSGGKVVLGEFGAPVPDIHGAMSEHQQALWLDGVLSELSKIEELEGINYWTSFGGTTGIWTDDGNSRSAVNVLKGYYKPKLISGRVINELGRPVKNASVVVNSKTTETDKKGYFSILILPSTDEIKISAEGYEENIIETDDLSDSVILSKISKNIFFKIQKFIYNFFRWTI